MNIRTDFEKGVEIYTNKQCIQHILYIPKRSRNVKYATYLPEEINFGKDLKGVALSNFPKLSTPILWTKNDNSTQATLSINTEKGKLEHVIKNQGQNWYNLLISFNYAEETVVLYGEGQRL